MDIEPQGESRPKQAPPAPEPTALQRVESVGRAAGRALAGVAAPVVGDAFAEFMGGLFPSIKERRSDAWLEELRSAVNWLLQNALHIDDIRDNEQLHDLVWAATEAARRTHHDEKRWALRNAIVNAALPSAPSETKQHLFVRLVDELDVHHLQLLALMADQVAFLKARGLDLPGPAGGPYVERDALLQHQSQRSLQSIVNNVLHDELPSDLHEVTMQDLIRRGLVDPNATFSTLCVGRSLASPLGREFLRFVSEPTPPKAEG